LTDTMTRSILLLALAMGVILGPLEGRGEVPSFGGAVKGGLTLSVIYDNNPYDPRLSTAWGFSCLIEGAGLKVLFDTGGDGPLLLSNMEALGLRAEGIEAVVLSHIHGDHTGGLQVLLRRLQGVTLYLPQSFPQGFKDRVRLHGARVREVRGPLEICPGVYSTGEMGRGLKEQALLLRTRVGTILITGCAHPGVVQMVARARELTGGPISLVMGGFHLLGLPQAEVREIARALRGLGVCCVGPCHCSGQEARRVFREEFGPRFIEVGVGRRIGLKEIEGMVRRRR